MQTPRLITSLFISLTFAWGISTATAKDLDPPPARPDGAPRWLFLGEDDQLRDTIKESQHILLVCVYNTTLENVKPPSALVTLHATVAQSVKGEHKVGDKIRINFATDSLPMDAAERTKYIAEAADQYLGTLKLAFLFYPPEQPNQYGSEWLYVPEYDTEMLAFVMKNLKKQ